MPRIHLLASSLMLSPQLSRGFRRQRSKRWCSRGTSLAKLRSQRILCVSSLALICLRAAHTAILGALGHSGFQRVQVSVSAQRCCRTSLVVPCWLSSLGHWANYSKYTRDQAGSLSRLSCSMDTSAKCVLVGPVDYREGLQNSVWFLTALIQWGPAHSGGSWASSFNGTRDFSFLGEGVHRNLPKESVGSIARILLF